MQAAEGMLFVLVDCTQRTAHADLKKKYNVRGYPTFLFLDPDGNEVGKLGGRDAASVAAQFRQIVADHGRAGTAAGDAGSIEEGHATGAEEGKLPVVLFSDGSSDATTTAESFADESLAEMLEQCVLVIHDTTAEEHPEECGACEAVKYKRGSLIVLLNPFVELEEALDDPLTRLNGKRSAKSILSNVGRWVEYKWPELKEKHAGEAPAEKG